MSLELLSRQPQGNRRPKPLLFVHGAWHAAWCWDAHFLPYFAKHGYEAHALSLRGHGSSSGSYRQARSADYVADVRHIAATLHPHPVVIGHSMGSYIVQKYLEHHPAPAGILLAPVPLAGSYAHVIRSVVRQPLDALRAALRLDLHAFVDTMPKVRQHLFADDMPDADVRPFAARIQGESVRIVLDIAMLNPHRPVRINSPMLVIGAERDAMFTVNEVCATATAYNCKAHIIPNAAHDLMLDARWQQAATIMLDWLHAQGL